MENNNGFTYSYSAEKKNEAEMIRKKYLPREETPLERLKSLDARVGRAGVIESLIMGVIGCLIFGIGMCFGLDVFAGADMLTLVFMGLGAFIMAPAYAVYKRISRRTRDRLAPEILRISDELVNGQ